MLLNTMNGRGEFAVLVGDMIVTHNDTSKY